MYFDKRGRQISVAKWCKLKQDGEYARVALDTLENGKTVSTVWFGINFAFPPGKKIFETLIFPGGRYWGGYSTLEEAREGHLRAVDAFKFDSPLNPCRKNKIKK